MQNHIISSCTRCPLYQNQTPLLDHERPCDVMRVGLSAKKVEDVTVSLPLDSTTNTGKIIAQIEAFHPGVQFFKSNLVKCLPLDEHNKLRYPTKQECRNCLVNLQMEIEHIKPKLVILLGEKVAQIVLPSLGLACLSLSEQYNYAPVLSGNINYIAVHHPSHIAIYKRKTLDQYIDAISKTIFNFSHI